MSFESEGERQCGKAESVIKIHMLYMLLVFLHQPNSKCVIHDTRQ